MVTQKGDLYITLFSTLSGVRCGLSILSQLNICCTILAKQCQYYTKITINLLFAVHILQPYYVFTVLTTERFDIWITPLR